MQAIDLYRVKNISFRDFW